MSSAGNDSVEVLLGMFWANYTNHQKLQNQFEAQETRLLQRPDQTGALTAEQHDLNKRVLAVSVDLMATAIKMAKLDLLFAAYYRAQPNDQPQLRNQIQAKMGELDVMLINVEGKVQELEEIKK